MTAQIESHANRVLMLNVLASFGDSSDEAGKIGLPNVYEACETYSKFLVRLSSAKVPRKDQPKAYTAISPEVRQIVVLVFKRMLEEVKNIDYDELSEISRAYLTEADRAAIQEKCGKNANKVKAEEIAALRNKKLNMLAEKAVEANDMCVVRFMKEFITKKVDINPDSQLAMAFDEKNVFESMVTQGLTSHYEQQNIDDAPVKYLFNQFLKCLGFVINQHIWYNHVPVGQKLVCGLLAQYGMDMEMMSTLLEGMRQKKPREKKAKKPADGKTADGETAEAAGTPADTPNDTPANTQDDTPDDTPAGTQDDTQDDTQAEDTEDAEDADGDDDGDDDGDEDGDDGDDDGDNSDDI